MTESAVVATTKAKADQYYRWVEPDSDITVCLNPGTIERLQREALLGAFEIGGILLGRTEFEASRTVVFVEDFQEIPRGDSTGFEAARTPGAVGYFRSHNRDGLFLGPDDMRVIRRYFSRPENIVLLVKTLPSGACTAGFFFWKNGQIQADFTDSEAPLIPIALSAEERGRLRTEEHHEPSAPGLLPGAGPAVHSRRGWGAVAGVIGVAAVVALGVSLQRPRLPVASPGVRAAEPRPVPAAVATSVPSAPVAREAPPAMAREPQENEIAPAAVYRELQPAGIATPVPRSAILRPQADVEPIAPAPLQPAPLQGLSVAAERLPEMAAAPPAPASLTPQPPAEAPVSRSYSAAQVIHQVSPAVPRGVGPMITSDVQVDVTVTIDAQGRVTSSRVTSTRGVAASLLTIEALKAADLFRFQPARENGRDVPSSTALTFRFARTK